jgi:hypothetical protein
MSSTKRGKSRIRHDNYPTPYWCTHRLLEAVNLHGGQWLEPCAGDGAIIKAVNAHEGDKKSIYWTACELRKIVIPRLRDAMQHSGEILEGDFFMQYRNQRPRFNVCITNPPFNMAMEFVSRCRLLADHTVMLLRLNFVSSAERSAFMQETKPDIYVLPNRPSFVGGGKTDSIEYAWFHWHRNSTGQLRVLALTPKEERISKRRRK